MSNNTILPELAPKLAALLRGSLQTTGALMRISEEQGYCYCIEGVICELYRLETGCGEWVDEVEDGSAPNNAGSFRLGFKDHWDAAPLEVIQWATGSTITAVEFDVGNCPSRSFLPLRRAIELNDAGWDFNDFANALTENES